MPDTRDSKYLLDPNELNQQLKLPTIKTPNSSTFGEEYFGGILVHWKGSLWPQYQKGQPFRYDFDLIILIIHGSHEIISYICASVWSSMVESALDLFNSVIFKTMLPFWKSCVFSFEAFCHFSVSRCFPFVIGTIYKCYRNWMAVLGKAYFLVSTPAAHILPSPAGPSVLTTSRNR